MYRIIFKRKAAKELSKLPLSDLLKVSASIEELEKDPRPAGSKKLKGSNENTWRIRIGDYRAVYVIEDVVRRVAHRKDAYL